MLRAFLPSLRGRARYADLVIKTPPAPVLALGEKITLKQLRHDMERRLGVESLKEWKENGTIKAVATAFAKGARRREEMAAALNHQAAGTLDAMSMGDLTFTHMAQPPQ